METLNFLITGVGGQGTVVASDIMAAVGFAAGYDVKKSDMLGLSVRGGGVIGHVRWGDEVFSPIVPDGRGDILVAFEVLEGLRWLNQMRPTGTAIVNQQKIFPVTVASGLAEYPTNVTVEKALLDAVEKSYSVPAIDMALELGNSKVLNIALLGATSALLEVKPEIWEDVITERVPAKYKELNVKAFHKGRDWMLANKK
jgi:indolepyruvate ferredoxin oxidoreductase beta subunit